LTPLVPIGHRFNATAYLSIVSDCPSLYGQHVPILWWLLPAG